MQSNTQTFRAAYTVSVFFVASTLVGCGSTPTATAPTQTGAQVSRNLPLPDVSRKSLHLHIEENLPDKPASGRAFLGLRTADCSDAHIGSGLYVIGFFEFNGKSPSRDAGIKIGDKILSINGRYGVNESNLTKYIQHVSKTMTYNIVIQRKTGPSLQQHSFSVLSFGLPEDCISKDRVEPCLTKPGLKRENACSNL